MQEGDGEPDEYMIKALTIIQSRSAARNDFFMKVGEEIVAFAKTNDLTVDELCVTIGHLAGAFAITAVRVRH